jgi:hypothetical protein
LYVLDCFCCDCPDVLPEVPQPARARAKVKSNIRRVLRDLLPTPNKKSGSGPTMARANPAGPGIHPALLVVLTVIVVLCGVLPDRVAGAKVQPHPLGKPEQANDNAALNPFSGATFTVMDPGVTDVTVRVPLDKVSP